MDDYNGWTNYETWNVALWVQNSEHIYNIARGCTYYDELAKILIDSGSKSTLDGVGWLDDELNDIELDAMIAEL